ncbi:MAG: MerR family transcriptional regulator [Desulfatitalea sp.]|nr:MerR family transcriptional regulator [Desulfatitalea sp.]
MMESIDQKLTIQKVSERLGLPKSTLRYWEKTFDGLIAPERTTGGQRRYAIEDLTVFETIKRLKRSGLSLAQIQRQILSGQSTVTGATALHPQLVDHLAESILNEVRYRIHALLKQE